MIEGVWLEQKGAWSIWVASTEQEPKWAESCSVSFPVSCVLVCCDDSWWVWSSPMSFQAMSLLHICQEVGVACWECREEVQV